MNVYASCKNLVHFTDVESGKRSLNGSREDDNEGSRELSRSNSVLSLNNVITSTSVIP